MMSNHRKVEDQWLVLKCQSGDKQALNILVKKWHPKLVYYSYGLVKDMEVAQDVVQDSWASIIFKIRSLKDPQKFQFWASSIVHHKSIDWIRKQQRKRKEEEVMVVEGTDHEGKDASDKEDKINQILKGLADLKHNDKAILTLFYLREQSVYEISQILNIPLGTVKSRLYTAREHLKKLLKHKDHG